MTSEKQDAWLRRSIALGPAAAATKSEEGELFTTYYAEAVRPIPAHSKPERLAAAAWLEKYRERMGIDPRAFLPYDGLLQAFQLFQATLVVDRDERPSFARSRVELWLSDFWRTIEGWRPGGRKLEAAAVRLRERERRELEAFAKCFERSRAALRERWAPLWYRRPAESPFARSPWGLR